MTSNIANIDNSNIPDKRSLIVKLAEKKNEVALDNAFAPAVSLGAPKKGSKYFKDYMAMDTCIRNVLSQINASNQFVRFPAFVGYALLSSVSQEALIRAGVEAVADDMTRKPVELFYDEDGNEDGEKLINDLNADLLKFKVKEVMNNAKLKDGFFGGCLVYIDVGNLSDEQKMKPLLLDKRTFKAGSLRGFKIIEPVNICAGDYNTTDPMNEHFFNPEWWYILGKRYHASRFLYIAGNDVDMLLKPAYNFFGISEAQLALDYVAHFVANREAAQELLNKFSLTCIGTNLSQALTQDGSWSDIVARIKAFNKFKTNNGTFVFDKETEELMQLNTPLSGVKDIVEMSLTLLTAIWRIPKLVYIGEGEGGLNASSQEQLRTYYSYIHSLQEKIFTKPYDTIIKLLQLNRGLEPDEKLMFKFPSLWDMDEKERADLNKVLADRDIAYINSGVLSQEEARKRLSLDRNSGYSDIDVDDLPTPPEQPLQDEEPKGDKKGDKTTDDMALDEKEPVDWITVHGVHIPLYEGQSKEDAVSGFIEKVKGQTEKKGNKNDRTESKNEFGRIQAESQGMSSKELSEYRSGERKVDEALLGRLSRAFKMELHARTGGRGDKVRTLLNPKTGQDEKIHENVDGETFKNIFSVARNYLQNGELVDLHDDYSDCECYLTEDGLGGFAIEKDGNLVSVFNLNTQKGGFLKTIAPIVKEKAKFLDCFMSEKQPLAEMYSKIFGFKVVSDMPYNMEYDHDDIGKNHNMPKVAFMVNTEKELKTTHFDKDDYDGAYNLQRGFFGNMAKDSAFERVVNRIVFDEFVEREHPRDKYGKFTKKGANEEPAYKKNAKAEKTSLSDEEKAKYVKQGNESITDYAKRYDEPDVNESIVLNGLQTYISEAGETHNREDMEKAIHFVERKIEEGEETINKYRISGRRNEAVYTPERSKLHKAIARKLLQGKKKSDNPTFVLLGGRGGSGKSQFKNEVYDEKDFVVLDADKIKEMLPEYKGWNAAHLHEESADILEFVLGEAKRKKLNVVLDATMNGFDSTKRRLGMFKDDGYRAEMHYMFLPRQKAARRAITRFVDRPNGRYVPINMILGMQKNEENFEKLKGEVDAYSFSNNDVPFGKLPVLVEKSGDFYYKGARKWI